MSKSSNGEIHVSACPTCHSIIPAPSPPCPESSAGTINVEKNPAELPTADVDDNRQQ